MNSRFILTITAVYTSLFITSVLHADSASGSNTTDIPIPDNGGWVYSTINISGAPPGATITGIDVDFDIVHTFSGDLIVDLEVGSYSNSARLWDREGGSSQNPSRSTSTSEFNGLPVNNTWYLYVRDYEADDIGYLDRWSITIYYTEVSPPSEPSLTSPGSSLSPGTTEDDFTPRFRWSSVSGATGYGLYISKYPYGSSNVVYENEAIGSTTSFTLPSGILESNTKYRWNMRAKNSAGWSSYSTRLYFQMEGIPVAPSNLGTQAFSDRIVLGWNDNSSNENGFKIERRVISGSWSQIGTTGSNSDSTAFYTDYSVMPNTTYIYRVRAYNSIGNSAYSDEVTNTTPGGPPGDFSLSYDPPYWDAQPPAGPAVNLYWTPSEDAGSYALYRNDEVYTSGISGTTYLNNLNLAPGETYTYYIRASNADGSTDSNAVTITMPEEPVTPPDAPVITSIGSTQSPGEIIATTSPKFIWQTTLDATTYGLYISRFPYGTSNIVYSHESLTGTSHTIPNGYLVSGERYKWNMVSKNDGGESSISNSLYFQISTASTLPPVALDPGAGYNPGVKVSSLTPMLSWDTQDNSSFSVYISKRPFGTSHIIYSVENIDGNSHKVPEGVLNHGTDYRWNMVGISGGKETQVSNTLYFYTTPIVESNPLETPTHDMQSPPSFRLINVAHAAGEETNNFTFNIQTPSPAGMCRVEISSDLENWEILGEFPIDTYETIIRGRILAQHSALFYRAHYIDPTPTFQFPIAKMNPYHTRIVAMPDMDESKNGQITFRGVVYEDHVHDYKGTGLLGYAAPHGGALSFPFKYDDGLVGGENTHVFYDGHNGYDFAVERGKDILAVASGFLFPLTDFTAKSSTDTNGVWRRNDTDLPSEIKGNNFTYRYSQTQTHWDKYHAVYIIHESGYITFYLHADSISSDVLQDLRDKGFSYVVRGQKIGKVGDKGSEGAVHLHFGVRKLQDDTLAPSGSNTLLVDPYFPDPTDPEKVLWEVAPE